MNSARILVPVAALSFSLLPACSAAQNEGREAQDAMGCASGSANCIDGRAAQTAAQAVLPPYAERLCAEARAAALAAAAVHEENVGRIVRADYRKTELPRPDGKMAVVLTGITAQVKHSEASSTERQSLAYIEDRLCWTRGERGSVGNFSCYASDDPPAAGATLVRDKETRRFLSVVVFLSTAGRSDVAAQAIASGAQSGVPMELSGTTSAPSEISAWYFCQTCGRTALSLPAVDTAGLTFGRTARATYFRAREGVTARLRDGDDRAAYTVCKS